MLTVLPVQSKEEQKSLCEAVGVSFRAASFTYAARVDGTLVGLSQFRIENGRGVMENLVKAPDTNDTEAMFIMARATMRFLDKCGLEFCRFDPDAADEKFMRELGFNPDGDGFYAINLKKFYESPCHYQEIRNQK